MKKNFFLLTLIGIFTVSCEKEKEIVISSSELESKIISTGEIPDGFSTITHFDPIIETDDYTLYRLSLKSGKFQDIEIIINHSNYITPSIRDFRYSLEIRGASVISDTGMSSVYCTSSEPNGLGDTVVLTSSRTSSFKFSDTCWVQEIKEVFPRQYDAGIEIDLFDEYLKWDSGSKNFLDNGVYLINERESELCSSNKCEILNVRFPWWKDTAEKYLIFKSTSYARDNPQVIYGWIKLSVDLDYNLALHEIVYGKK